MFNRRYIFKWFWNVSIVILAYPGAYYMFFKVAKGHLHHHFEGCEVTSICVTWAILPSMQSTCQYHSSRQVPALVLASCCGIWPTWNCGRGQSCPLLSSFRSDSKNKIYHDTLINSISRCTWGICTQIRAPPPKKNSRDAKARNHRGEGWTEIQGWRQGVSDPESSMRRPKISGEYAG